MTNISRVAGFFAAGLLLTGCFVVRREVIPANPMGEQWGGWFAEEVYTSNGEQIYFAAVNEDGQRIRYSGGSSSGGMMMGAGASLACASCHGLDGRGGLNRMHMDVMDAPDIRLSALRSEGEEHAEGDDHEGGHADEHGEYDLDDFRRAVVDGTHPDGEPLSREMPRWRMADKDLGR
jgi:hypothetical protein